MTAQYFVEVVDSISRELTVRTFSPDGGWVPLYNWWAGAGTRHRTGSGPFLKDLDAELSEHGWQLGRRLEHEADSLGDRTRRNSGVGTAVSFWSVTPVDWRQLLTDATKARRDAAEQATRVDQAWQTLIVDIPRTDIPITEIASLVGLTRARVHTIRREGNLKPSPTPKAKDRP